MSIIAQAGLVNSQNSHFSNPGYSSSEGAVTGCGGSVTSADALNGTGMYEMVKVGGKKHKKGRKSRRKYRGGGYGFSKNQSFESNYGGYLMDHDKYENVGTPSDTNMGASSSSTSQLGGSFGEGGNPFYSYKPSEGEDLSTFAGSGYPPITRALNSQCGGKRKSSKKGKKSVKKSAKKSAKKIAKKSVKKSAKKGKKTAKKGKTAKRKQKGGYSQYLSNVASTPSYSLGGDLKSSDSALASPPPFTPKNECMNSWKHTGDTPPYNKNV